ncbi:hypothetical protein FQN54_002547 [Arachnomyces sp. PD_36]|nr:hypothetical protein FQN54_002547 [Arachnomyces sp. PD_36]
MSTISSPRLSIASGQAITPTSSRRPSFENSHNNNNSTPASQNASPSVTQRRNRTALRDYYNLKPPTGQPKHGATLSAGGDRLAATSPTTSTELDNPNFDPSEYISHLLATSSLSTILKAENSLVSDIRTLDGERKALVYDNYSKLIKAVETIGNMRASMEDKGAPLTMTKTLGPAVGFVAETAGNLIREGEEQSRVRRKEKEAASKDNNSAARDTVKWVLDAPRRLEMLMADGKSEEARSDWGQVKGLLTKWEGVKGVAEVRAACEEIMGDGN